MAAVLARGWDSLPTELATLILRDTLFDEHAWAWTPASDKSRGETMRALALVSRAFAANMRSIAEESAHHTLAIDSVKELLASASWYEARPNLAKHVRVVMLSLRDLYLMVSNDLLPDAPFMSDWTVWTVHVLTPKDHAGPRPPSSDRQSGMWAQLQHDVGQALDSLARTCSSYEAMFVDDNPVVGSLPPSCTFLRLRAGETEAVRPVIQRNPHLVRLTIDETLADDETPGGSGPIDLPALRSLAIMAHFDPNYIYAPLLRSLSVRTPYDYVSVAVDGILDGVRDKMPALVELVLRGHHDYSGLGRLPIQIRQLTCDIGIRIADGAGPDACGACSDLDSLTTCLPLLSPASSLRRLRLAPGPMPTACQHLVSLEKLRAACEWRGIGMCEVDSPDDVFAELDAGRW